MVTGLDVQNDWVLVVWNNEKNRHPALDAGSPLVKRNKKIGKR